MRFLIDQNLPVGLLPVLAAMGHDADHIKLRGLSQAADEFLWLLAKDEDRVVVSKDIDFAIIARRSADGSFLRLAIGNCPNSELYALVQKQLASAVLRLANGERIVEITP